MNDIYWGRRTMTVASQRMFGILERWNNNQVTPSLSKPYELSYRSNTIPISYGHDRYFAGLKFCIVFSAILFFSCGQPLTNGWSYKNVTVLASPRPGLTVNTRTGNQTVWFGDCERHEIFLHGVQNFPKVFSRKSVNVLSTRNMRFLWIIWENKVQSLDISKIQYEILNIGR